MSEKNNGFERSTDGCERGMVRVEDMREGTLEIRESYMLIECMGGQTCG